MTQPPEQSPVGKHPWSDESGRISAQIAATWMVNHILMAGGMATTAFKCAALVADDIEKNPTKFQPDTQQDQRRILTNACQLIDGFKNDPSLAPGEWSEFDETTRRELGKLLKSTYETK